MSSKTFVDLKPGAKFLATKNGEIIRSADYKQELIFLKLNGIFIPHEDEDYNSVDQYGNLCYIPDDTIVNVLFVGY